MMLGKVPVYPAVRYVFTSWPMTSMADSLGYRSCLGTSPYQWVEDYLSDQAVLGE
jgi:hypothetical protein